MADNLDRLWQSQEGKQQLLTHIDSNPLILETIIEKSMKI